MKKINEKENKLCIICNKKNRLERFLFCRKCSKEQNNYVLMDLDIDIKNYPNLFEYKKD